MFYLTGIFRTSSLGGSISSNLERIIVKRQGEETGYMELLQQRAVGLNIKILLLIKGSQISQVKKYSVFLCMGR